MNFTESLVGSLWAASAVKVFGYIWQAFKDTYKEFPTYGAPGSTPVPPPGRAPKRPRQRRPRLPRGPLPFPRRIPAPFPIPVPAIPNVRPGFVRPGARGAPVPSGPQPGSPFRDFPFGPPPGDTGPSIDIPGLPKIPLPPLPDFSF